MDVIADRGSAGNLASVSTLRPDDEPDDPHGSGEQGSSGAEAGGRGGRPHPESPLDYLFIVGAKYHEPSAAERAAAAKAADRAQKKAAKENEKEIARTRRVLRGDKPSRRGFSRHRNDFSVTSYERKNALIGLVVLVAVSVALSFTQFAH